MTVAWWPFTLNPKLSAVRSSVAVNDNVIARRFYSGQPDLQKRDAVGPNTAQPLSRTTNVNIVYVEERADRTLLRGGLNLTVQRYGPLCQ